MTNSVHRMLNESLGLPPREGAHVQTSEVQRVTLTDNRENNNMDTSASGEMSVSPTREDLGFNFMSRSYRALGPDTRAVLLRRRMRMRAMAERLRMIDNIGLDDDLPDQRRSRMSPPVAIPLLTPTQIADRLEQSHRYICNTLHKNTNYESATNTWTKIASKSPYSFVIN